MSMLLEPDGFVRPRIRCEEKGAAVGQSGNGSAVNAPVHTSNSVAVQVASRSSNGYGPANPARRIARLARANAVPARVPTVDAAELLRKNLSDGLGKDTFRRRCSISGRPGDSLCLEVPLVIQIDGVGQAACEVRATVVLAECEFRVVRFWSDEVSQRLDEVITEESPNRGSTPAGAVFLSYASQDAQPARRLGDALRAAGIEVWFDQSELRGGDVWDRKIRQQIRDCTLFVPVVSQNTQERLEGYFRLEWRLAVDRSHLMATERPFLVPVVVDGTCDQEAIVPDAFREVQWTRVPAGDTPSAFVEHVRRLLSPDQSRATTTIRAPAGAASGTAAAIGRSVRASWRSRSALRAMIAVAVLVALTYFVIDKIRIPEHSPTSRPMTSAAPEAAPRATSATFDPPPHSIAVPPFVNMSGDRQVSREPQRSLATNLRARPNRG